ncbi:hypothetical protein BDZ97DRAFT_1923855 [Flammula alnicola]|nr:hypothetical protein BDZ97DRAFT_1923855 [Flammula alnicola]
MLDTFHPSFFPSSPHGTPKHCSCPDHILKIPIVSCRILKPNTFCLSLPLLTRPAVFALPSSPVQLSRRQNGTNPNDALPGWTFSFSSIAFVYVHLPSTFPFNHATLLTASRSLSPTQPKLTPPSLSSSSEDNPASRTLLEANIANPATTPALCTAFCSGTDFPSPFNFAGTEFTS